eukprot:NODE_357_length_2359_cov_52.422491_g333_i0.p1 GENE.NODE_357_length_2359_cov_52.422491_g333_i0~~NODE_357_length_2359_cov_52.422491_g333_i0.p1  ORF type:complete len:724 (+),score=155.56 NODE_357_length_2359_cov_52.422491_g333_i0:18-2189(+)
MIEHIGSWEDGLDEMGDSVQDGPLSLSLLPGEEEHHRVPGVAVEGSDGDPAKALLIVTNYRILTIPTAISVPLGCISKAQEVFQTPNGYGVLYSGSRRNQTAPYPVILHCKDGRCFQFLFLGHASDVDLFLDILEKPFPPFAFTYHDHCRAYNSFGCGPEPDMEGLPPDHPRSKPIQTPNHSFAPSPSGSLSSLGSLPLDPGRLLKHGWTYDARAEYGRMGIEHSTSWRLSDVNADYQVCESYPRLVCVPKAATDEIIKGSALFRSKSRFPMLCWRCKSTGSTIHRSSQPLVGLRFNRCPQDEKLLLLMQQASRAKVLYIFDCRPKVNAVANAAISGGYESDSVYRNCKLLFCGIPNLHSMRDSLDRLQNLASRTQTPNKPYSDAHYYSALEGTQWLDHIRSLLILAVQVVDLMSPEGGTPSSVLIHCSDGWDRTSQLCSLAQLLLDPYYRTLVGFFTLIEKEWISVGHKFGDRYGNQCSVDSLPTSDQQSPIFLQFVCCVRQILEEFPGAFEFNELFLHSLLEHHASCLFGTFIGNTDKERAMHDVAGRTLSFWNYASDHAKQFRNLWYEGAEGASVLRPKPSFEQMKVWATNRSVAEMKLKVDQQLKVIKRILKQTHKPLVQPPSTQEPICTEDLSDESAGTVLVTKLDSLQSSASSDSLIFNMCPEHRTETPEFHPSHRAAQFHQQLESMCNHSVPGDSAKLIEDYFGVHTAGRQVVSKF